MTIVRPGRPVIGGLVAGVLAGGVLLALTLVTSLVGDPEIWQPMKAAAAPFLGERAMTPGFDAVAVLIGLPIHFVVCLVWGLIFALVVEGRGRRATLVAGPLFGFVTWLAMMYYLLLPVGGLSSLVRSMHVTTSLLGHLVFGVALGIGFVSYRGARRPRRPPPAAGSILLAHTNR